MSSPRPARRRPVLAHLWLVVVSVFVLAPLVVVVVNSFSSVAYSIIPPPGLSLRWYRNLGSIPDLSVGLRNSLTVSLIATALSVLIGFGAAYGFSRRRSRLGPGLAASLQLPFVIPRVALGLAFFVLWLRFGVYGSQYGLVVSHVVITLPITAALFAAALADVPPESEEAAHDLGAGRLYTITRVVLPQLRSAFIGAALLAFIISFDEVEMTLFLADRDTITLPIAMFNYVQRYQDPTAAALSTVMIVIGLLLGGAGLLAARRAVRRRNVL
ncbi:MAG: ABC transporter permease subunit [Micromonosporaceae bacterium]|nr:ABC transporter permease subunit [Micromonosporaceae bacterium]